MMFVVKTKASVHAMDSIKHCPIWGVFAFLVVFLFGAVVHATSNETYRQEARTMFKEGRALYGQKQYDRALIKFQAVLDLTERMIKQAESAKERQSIIRSQAIFFCLTGQTHEALKQWAPAYQSYLRCLERNPKPEIAKLAAQQMQQMAPQVTIQLEIQTNPSNVALQLFGPQGVALRGETPFIRNVLPGSYRVLLSKPKYQKQRIALELQAGPRSVSKLYQMERIREETPPPPVVRPAPNPSNSTLLWENYQQRRTVTRGTAWGMSGLAVVGVGVGIALVAVSQGEWAQYNRKRGQDGFSTNEVNGHFAQANLTQTLSIVSFIVGGAAAATAIGLFVWNGGQAPPPPPPITHPASKTSILSVFP